MPNWVQVRLAAIGPRANLVDIAYALLPKDLEEGEDPAAWVPFEALVPLPGAQYDIDVAQDTWGTKHAVFVDDGFVLEFPDDEAGIAMWQFESAWNPPLRWLDSVSVDQPAVSFVIAWVEPDMLMHGTAFARGGLTQRIDHAAEAHRLRDNIVVTHPSWNGIGFRLRPGLPQTAVPDDGTSVTAAAGLWRPTQPRIDNPVRIVVDAETGLHLVDEASHYRDDPCSVIEAFAASKYEDLADTLAYDLIREGDYGDLTSIATRCLELLKCPDAPPHVAAVVLALAVIAQGPASANEVDRWDLWEAGSDDPMIGPLLSEAADLLIPALKAGAPPADLLSAMRSAYTSPEAFVEAARSAVASIDTPRPPE